MRAGGYFPFQAPFFSAIKQSLSMGDSFSFASTFLQLSSGLFSTQTPQIVSINIDPDTLFFGTAKGSAGDDLLPPLVAYVDIAGVVDLNDRSAIGVRILEASTVAGVTAEVTTGSTGYTFEEVFDMVQGTTDTYETVKEVTFDEVGPYSIGIIVADASGNVSHLATSNVAVIGDVTKGDLNGDNVLNYTDLFTFLLVWQQQRTTEGYNNLADFNDDQAIDLGDLRSLFTRWHLVNQ